MKHIKEQERALARLAYLTGYNEHKAELSPQNQRQAFVAFLQTLDGVNWREDFTLCNHLRRAFRAGWEQAEQPEEGRQ